MQERPHQALRQQAVAGRQWEQERLCRRCQGPQPAQPPLQAASALLCAATSAALRALAGAREEEAALQPAVLRPSMRMAQRKRATMIVMKSAVSLQVLTAAVGSALMTEAARAVPLAHHRALLAQPAAEASTTGSAIRKLWLVAVAMLQPASPQG